MNCSQKFLVNRKNIFGLLALFSISYPWLSATCTCAETPTIEAAGLRVAAPAPPEEGQEMKTFNMGSGTTISLTLRKPSGGIISFVKESSKLADCKDDKGTDLLKNPKPEGMSMMDGFGAFPTVSADGKALHLEVSAPAIPVKGATQIQLTGELAIQVATQKKDFPADINLKADEKINAGAIPLTIGKAGAPEWGGEDWKFSVTLKASKELSSIASIKFLDEKGKEIESKTGGKSSMGFGDQVTVEQEFLFKAPIAKARIVVSYWTDMQTVKVPLSLKVGIGL